MDAEINFPRKRDNEHCEGRKHNSNDNDNDNNNADDDDDVVDDEKKLSEFKKKMAKISADNG